MEPRTLGEGRYVLLEELGQGGMATVWRATDSRLAVERAIKVLNPGLRSSSLRSRFDREARLMARLEHPHIVPVHDVGAEGSELYMVMSLLRNGSVGDHLDRFGPLAPVQACRVVEGVLSALSAAHAAGVIHRDVKPQNVLIGDHGEVRLGDFGIARVGEGSSTRTGAVMGTIGFMPPEQRSSSKETDARSDVYAVGALLISILLAEVPGDLFHPEALKEQAARIAEPLRPFVERCTRFSPAERYPDAESALAALRAAMAALPPDPPDTVPLGAARARVLAPQIPVHSSGSTMPSLSEGYTPTVPAPPPPAVRRRWGWAVGLGVTAVLVGGAGLCGGSGLAAFGWWATGSSVGGIAAIPAAVPQRPPEPGSSVASPVGTREVPPPEPGQGEASQSGPSQPEPSPSEPGQRAPGPPEPGTMEPRSEPTPNGVPQGVPTGGPEEVPKGVPDLEPAADPDPHPVRTPVAAPSVSTLKVRLAADPSAELEIDRVRVGYTPRSVELPVGKHTVRLLRDGKLAIQREIEVREGGKLEYCWVLATEEPCSR